MSHYSATVQRFLRNITLAGVKDYVQIGVGLSAITGGLITAFTVFGGDDAPATAITPTETPAVIASLPTETPTSLVSPVTAMVPATTPTSTPEPAPARRDFLRVQFGTQQDPVTKLPTGVTVGPDGNLELCPGGTLFAWAEHNFKDGDILNGRLTTRSGTLYSASVPVDQRSPNFWLSVVISETGIHTFHVGLEGGDTSASWSVNVVCNR